MTDKLVIGGLEEWSFDKIQRTYDVLDKINNECFKLDIFPNQLEIISAEQMVDSYTSGSLPIMYPHWSFGGEFLRHWTHYKRGISGLAYEVVINTNPCIAYLMEENTMLTQALVIAHSVFGHSTFFKTNYMMKQWTDPTSIIDYLLFARKYILECEEKYGRGHVEFILDASHALQMYGIDRYKRPEKKTKVEKEDERKFREAYRQSKVNELWSTIPKLKDADPDNKSDRPKLPEEPEENILYFIEKNAPRLQPWEREIIRIVRKVSQYFYPNMCTQLENEACATFWHYELVMEMERRGHLTEGAMFEFLQLHTAVAHQRQDAYGFNVYALGFDIMKNIKRIALDPTPEDKEWFKGQDWVGGGDWIAAIKYAVANYKSDSFVQQYLCPETMRKFGMWIVNDNEKNDYYEVMAIQDERGYQKIRENLANKYNLSFITPSIEVSEVDIWDSRVMLLRHHIREGRALDKSNAMETLAYCSALWGYPVALESVDTKGEVIATYPDEDDMGSKDNVMGIILVPGS